MAGEVAELDTIAQSDELAYEVVLAFFDDDQICLRYDLKREELSQLRQRDDFRRKMLEAKKRIADDGELFRLQAQEYANLVLADLYSIAKDEMGDEHDDDRKPVPLGQRMKAIELINRYAGYDKDANAVSGVGMQIHLQTNLALGPLDKTDSYVIDVKPDPTEGLI